MLMQIDGTFLFVAISFLIFLFIIKNILFNPITRVIEERENFYDKNSKMELESKEKTSALLKSKEEALKEARKEAAQIVKDASKEAKDKSALKIKETKSEIQHQSEENLEALKQESLKAKNELIAEVNSIVSTIISKVLKEEKQVSLEDEKIKQYLKI